MHRSLLLVALFAVAVLCRRLPEEDEIGGPIPLCSDGKGALLEAGRVFRCSQTCPDGFFCEFRDEAKTLERGICCPDLEKLFQLYGGNDTDGKVTELRRKAAGRGAENATRSTELGGLEEIIVDLTKLDEEAELEEMSQTLESDVTEGPESDPIPTPGELKIPVSASKTETERTYSCKRHRFRFACRNGTVPTQFTLRWYANDGQCYSYPYGFCPGTLVVDDNKIRTKKDCEEYCLDASSQGFKDVPIEVKGEKEGELGDSGSSPPKEFTKVDYDELKKACERVAPFRDVSLESDVTEGPESDPIPTPGELKIPVSASKTETERTYSCKRHRFRFACRNGTVPTQFTLRWYANNGQCYSYPYGFCPGTLVVDDNKIRTKKDCEEYCLDASSQGFKDVPVEVKGEKEGELGDPGSSSPKEFTKEDFDELSGFISFIFST
uniref:BPTI/Kunitz inhibitor domain-containing protein n=1 Tax=Steinernema glaseri TaxID=37863 RepID=A0A1I7Y9H8_9BILA